MARIDYDRGVVKRKIQKSGIEIFMYTSEPGVFRNQFGDEVDESLAKAAGFDVEKLGKERFKRERVKQALAEIEAELSSDGAEEKVVDTRNGYQLVSIGLGRHIVRDPDGSNITPVPVPQQEARLLFDKLVPKKAAAKKVAEKVEAENADAEQEPKE